MYLDNRRFLSSTHPLRKATKRFPSGRAEHRPPPETLTQEEVLLNSLAYENAKNPTQAAGFATATGSKGCPCLMLLPGHDRTKQAFPDTMHLIKNAVCEMVQILSGHNDSVKVRNAEENIGRFRLSWVPRNKETSNSPAMSSGRYSVVDLCLSSKVKCRLICLTPTVHEDTMYMYHNSSGYDSYTEIFQFDSQTIQCIMVFFSDLANNNTKCNYFYF